MMTRGKEGKDVERRPCDPLLAATRDAVDKYEHVMLTACEDVKEAADVLWYEDTCHLLRSILCVREMSGHGDHVSLHLATKVG